MGWKVAATFYFPGLDFGEDKLAGVGATLEKKLCQTPKEIIALAHDADAVISPTSVQPYTRPVVEQLAKCRIIASVGIGYESIDLPTATEMGIAVTNTPDYCLEEVSDHALALMLALARKIPRVQRAVREGKWTTSPELRKGILPPMFHLRGQTLGLIGFGRIARALVPKAKGFGLQIVVYDPYVSAEALAGLGVEKVDLDRLLRESDFISVHAALTPQNHHLLGLNELKKMKPTAYLVNTARGGLVDEKTLLTALEQKHIAGAGLDVLETEPPDPNSPLLQMDNVIITGHTAQFSDHSEAELWRRPADEIVRVFQGQWPVHVVNPQVKEKFFSRWGTASAPQAGSTTRR